MSHSDGGFFLLKILYVSGKDSENYKLNGMQSKPVSSRKLLMIICNQVLQSFHVAVIRNYKINHISENIHLFFFNAVVAKMKDIFINSILLLFCPFRKKSDIFEKFSYEAE